jgi:hypothetical protein
MDEIARSLQKVKENHMETEFKVGDKVVRNLNHSGALSVGTIVRITPKRKDVVVDYGNYEEIYDNRGWQKSDSIWSRSFITLLTSEIEKEIEDRRIIAKCKSEFGKVTLTADQAAKILEILGEK